MDDVSWQREDSAAVNAGGWMYSPDVSGTRSRRETRGSRDLESMVDGQLAESSAESSAEWLFLRI